jgi:hypothetical protein
MRPPMTELDDLLIEDWSEASAPMSWSQERTTKWTPQRLQPLPRRVQSRPENTRSDLGLYIACGAAALVLGLLSSRAFLPLLFGSEIALPKQFFLTSTPEEDAALVATQARSAAVPTKDSTRARKTTRARQLTAASPRGESALVQNRSRLLLRAAAVAEQPDQPFDPSVPPDLDLMDAPSSPMELRALADTRARMSLTSHEVMEMQRQHDPMGKLDVLQDPGVPLGLLRINSRPWAQVFIDDKPAGTTPLLGVSVSAGQHTVRLVNQAFGMRKTFDVSVNDGESISQVVSLDD